MDKNSAPWQQRYEMKTCAAEAVGTTIPPKALGVAVVYEEAGGVEKVLLVLESRSGSLRDVCLKRLQTAKLPTVGSLTVAFKGEQLPEASSEAVAAACREQVIFAGTIRRELKPAMR